MATFEFDLVCLGSGPAGQRAAVQAAKLGRRVAVVERSGVLGGVCLDTGTIPSKTFREAVLRMRGASRPGMAELLTRVNDVLARERAVV